MKAASKIPETPRPTLLEAPSILGLKPTGVEDLRRPGGPERFWLHLDADVLDDALLPAVDYRLPGGLSWQELAKVLQAAAESGGLVGLDVTIYNPNLDPDRQGARGLVKVLREALA